MEGRMSRGLRWGVLAAVFVVAGLLSGCVGGDSEDGTSEPSGTGGASVATGEAANLADADISVTLGATREFGIELSSPTAAAGEVTFGVTNGGKLPHGFAIARHDGDPGSLPQDGLNVDATQVDILADSGSMDPGATATITLDLEPGSYVIFSNTGGHYSAGMFIGFTVE